MLKRAECMLIVESPSFMKDPYIKGLFLKAIALGYNLEVIKEIFCKILLEFNFNAANVNENFNYEQLVNAEKFIDQLVIYSSQYESLRMGQHNIDMSNRIVANNDYYEDADSNNLMMFNEDDFDFESLNNETDSISYFNNKDKSNKELTINKMQPQQGKKPMCEQQKIQREQDFLNEAQKRINDPSNLRPIIVDCKDVALSDHANKQIFLISRVKQVVEYFEKKQHRIYVILSQSRKDQITSGLNPQQQKSNEQQILEEMEVKKQVHYTPNKRVGAKRIEIDDDNVKLKLAESKGGIIVSNNNFKKFLNHNDEFKLVIEERVLMYSFIDGTFMPAEDPLGKNGPSLENFLRFKQSVDNVYMKRCPYKKKCTYGSKCKFWHPERGMHQGNQLFKTAHQSVLDQAHEQKLRLEVILTKNQPDTYHNLPQLLTKKLSVSPPQPRDNTNKEKPIEKKNFSTFDQNSLYFNSLNLSDQIQTKFGNTVPCLRAMGPEQINCQPPKNTLTNLLAKQTDSLSDSNIFDKNFFERYGSSTMNNMDNFSMNNSEKPGESRLKMQLIQHLTHELADEVIRRYPNETDVDKLVYLARCLTTPDDDF